jgi:hypothetical protein
MGEGGLLVEAGGVVVPLMIIVSVLWSMTCGKITHPLAAGCVCANRRKQTSSKWRFTAFCVPKSLWHTLQWNCRPGGWYALAMVYLVEEEEGWVCAALQKCQFIVECLL